MKRSIFLPVIFSLGLLCSFSQKSEAIDVEKIALVGVGSLVALNLYMTYFEATDKEKNTIKLLLMAGIATYLINKIYMD